MKTAEIRTNMNALVEAYNKAIAEDDTQVLVNTSNELVKAEKLYAEEAKSEFLNACRDDEEDTVLAGIRKMYYIILKVKEVRHEGEVVAIELKEKTVSIQLVELCKFANVPLNWIPMVEKMGELLCIRKHRKLGWTAEQLGEIRGLYYLSDIAKRLNLGETPMSNTQVCKLMQTVIDAIVFIDDGSGKNRLKATAKDVEFLDSTYSKQDGCTDGVKVATTQRLTTILMPVLHNIFVGKTCYGVAFKQAKKRV